MPSQDPAQNQQQINQSTNPPFGDDLPPVPDFMKVDNSTPNGSSAPPPNFSSVVSGPKKKFGTAKIIASILGLVVLIGGVGAGVFLTQQQQILKPKAFSSGVRHDTCNLIEVTTSENNCPILGFDSGGKNNVSNYTTHYTIKNTTGDQHVISIDKHSNYCTEPYGVPCGSSCSSGSSSVPTCGSNPNDDSSEITLAAGESTGIDIPRASSSGTSCGSYQTDLIINSIDGNTNCTGGREDNLISSGVCQTGSTCQSTQTPTPTPNQTLSCVSLTKDSATPKLNDQINLTCEANFSSGNPVAYFRYKVDSGNFVEDTNPYPVDPSSHKATKSAQISVAGDWTWQCRVCTNNTKANCSQWGQSN